MYVRTYIHTYIHTYINTYINTYLHTYYKNYEGCIYHYEYLSVPSGGGKGTGPKSHIFDFPNGTLIWRKFAKLRMQLFPYIYTQAHISHDVSIHIHI